MSGGHILWNCGTSTSAMHIRIYVYIQSRSHILKYSGWTLNTCMYAHIYGLICIYIDIYIAVHINVSIRIKFKENIVDILGTSDPSFMPHLLEKYVSFHPCILIDIRSTLRKKAVKNTTSRMEPYDIFLTETLVVEFLVEWKGTKFRV